ncbi:hypothetical protein [Rhodococcus sp. ACS1]|uniref:hypothetical protein n=1 Tax=Rhodococcus sp. ACS1 TaxID=2028570 RepID=UPI00117ABCDC|nr:hypothetical protein [Rhodococcus sp. ACS1]
MQREKNVEIAVRANAREALDYEAGAYLAMAEEAHEDGDYGLALAYAEDGLIANMASDNLILMSLKAR